MNKIFFSLFSFFAVVSCSQAATVAFDFVNNGELDGNQAAGATMTRMENGETVTLTTVVLMAPDFDEPDPFATLISLGVDSSINNPTGLGINNPSTNNPDFNNDPNGGAGASENNNINFQESVTIEFDQTVTFPEVEFGSLNTAGEFIRINVEGVATDFDFFDGATNDTFADPLNGLVIPAGADVTFTGLGGTAIANARIDGIVVDVVPEPSSAILAWMGIGFGLKRRR